MIARPAARRFQSSGAWGRRTLVLVLAAVLALTSCQARVTVDTHLQRDGRGVLAVGLGLDDKALASIGDLDREVRLGDLTAAGWTVTKAHKEPDGLTWLRASRPFADVDELNRALADLTGPPAVFRDYKLVKDDTGTSFTYRLTGTVDTSNGVAPFRDQQLVARLGSDPIAAVEKEQGKKISDMVTFDVGAALEDAPAQVVHPTLKDTAPTALAVSLVEAKPPTTVGGGAPVGAVALGGVLMIGILAGARRAFRGRPS